MPSLTLPSGTSSEALGVVVVVVFFLGGGLKKQGILIDKPIGASIYICAFSKVLFTHIAHTCGAFKGVKIN